MRRSTWSPSPSLSAVRRARNPAHFGIDQLSCVFGEPGGGSCRTLGRVRWPCPRPREGARMSPPVRILLAFAALLLTHRVEAASQLVGDLPRAANRPLESLPGLDTEYGDLRAGDGALLRTIVTRPQ